MTQGHKYEALRENKIHKSCNNLQRKLANHGED